MVKPSIPEGRFVGGLFMLLQDFTCFFYVVVFRVPNNPSTLANYFVEHFQNVCPVRLDGERPAKYSLSLGTVALL